MFKCRTGAPLQLRGCSHCVIAPNAESGCSLDQLPGMCWLYSVLRQPSSRGHSVVESVLHCSLGIGKLLILLSESANFSSIFQRSVQSICCSCYFVEFMQQCAPRTLHCSAGIHDMGWRQKPLCFPCLFPPGNAHICRNVRVACHKR